MFNKDKAIQNAVANLQAKFDSNKQISNSGYEVDITTLTGIKQRITGQKFYEVKPSDFMPVTVGDNPFATELMTYKDFSTGGDFEAGNIEQGSGNSRLGTVDTKIDSIKVPIKTWGKKTNYNIVDLATATRSGNWSLIEAKERSRVKNWQLGIQQVAFLGLTTDTSVLGLLTQSDVNSNLSTIAKNLKDMTVTEFSAFIENALSDYYSNANNTVLPDTFVMPTDDFLGLATPFSETYPNVSRIEYMKKAFAEMTGNANFKVLPLAYAQLERNSSVLGSGSGLNRYVLYRSSDEESLRMDIPVDYTTTIFDTFNGFEYESVGYGQYTGCKAYRPKEMLYFDHQA